MQASPDTLTLAPAGGRCFRLTSRIRVPRPVDQVFPFFADAFNLERITPPFMSFRIVTPPPIQMAEGLRIDYKLRVRGVPLRWTSEIRRWNPPWEFQDVQLRGPYRRWEHTHRFEADGQDATLVSDEVLYEVPLAAWVNRWFVQPDVERIFRFRQQVIHTHFES